jgi:hypothetical protein
MNDRPLHNTDANHDTRGRFAKGNKAGKANPHHRRVAELRAKMLERVTPDDIAAVVEALVNKAKAGDTAATKLLFDRVFRRIADHDAAVAGSSFSPSTFARAEKRDGRPVCHPRNDSAFGRSD